MVDERIRTFVLDYLAQIGASVREEDGVLVIGFPLGFRRKYGRERHVTFDPEARREHVELMEPGSPLLKGLLADARGWGPLGVVRTAAHPPGTRVYTFQLEAYSSARKRSTFVHAVLEPGADRPVVQDGVPSFFATAPAEDARGADPEAAALREGVAAVVGAVEAVGREFARETVGESHEAFAKALDRVQDYFKGLHQDTFLEEARIRKRLGEIQSKLYFTEDGLRELKLQREQERLTQDLHALKKRNTQAQEALAADREKHADQLRRRHEPKLRVRLAAATLVQEPRAAPPSARASPAPPEPLL